MLESLAALALRLDHMTAAALLRSVERDSPSLLLDEYDAAMGSGDDYAEAMRGLLNSGFRRGGKYRLCEKGPGGEMTLRDYPTFCCKAIAVIGKLPDTVVDRGIPILLGRRKRSETVARFHLREIEPEAATLREALQAWAIQNVDRLRQARPKLPSALNDRQQDVCEQLLAIADVVGGEWPEQARRALVELCAGEAAKDESTGTRLLADIRAVFESKGVTRIPSRDLAAALGEMESAPWAEWKAGKPITPAQLARQLGRFGIAPRTIRLDGGATPKGYLRDDFADAWERYLAPDEADDNTPPPSPADSKRHTATSRVNTDVDRDFQNATDSICVVSENAVSPNKHAPCGGVAFSDGEHSPETEDGVENPSPQPATGGIAEPQQVPERGSRGLFDDDDDVVRV